VKTAEGISIVRKHHATSDAQKVYDDLSQHYVKSTRANIVASDLLAYISTSKLQDWPGTTEAFVLHWTEQCRLYNDLVPPTDKIGDGVKLTLLQNAVSHVSDFAQIKVTADQLSAGAGTKQTFQQYIGLLKSAVVTYDTKGTNEQTSGTARRRRVYQTEFWEPPEPPDEAFNIDTPVSTIRAFQAQRISGATMPRHSLSPDDQQRWDLFSDASKRLILQAYPSSGASLGRPPENRRPHDSRGARPPDRRSRDVSLADFAYEVLHDDPLPDGEEATISGSEPSEITDADTSEPTVDRVVNMTREEIGSVPPGHLARLMSKKMARPTENAKSGNRTRSNHMAKITYTISKRATRVSSGCTVLADRGANGFVVGKEMRTIDTGVLLPKVNIRAFDKHEQRDVQLVTAGGVVQTHRGPAIAIVHHGAHMPEHNTIMSCGQMEYHGLDVNDKSAKIRGGKQRIMTKEGYIILMDFRDGLPYINMRPYTDKEWDELPHIHLVNPSEWDPTVLDFDATNNEEFLDALQSEVKDDSRDLLFDLVGNFTRRDVNAMHTSHQDEDWYDATAVDDGPFIAVNKFSAYDSSDDDPITVSQVTTRGNRVTNVTAPPKIIAHGPKRMDKKDIDFEKYKGHFIWAPINIIKKTFENTTQYARMPMSDVLRKAYRSPNPALNVARREEAVATDRVFSDTPAVDNGATEAALFVGRDSLVADVYPLKTAKQFPGALQDNITERGAMNTLTSDRGTVEISQRVLAILRSLFIKSWQSEPGQQHQNFAERRYQDIKTRVNVCMDRTGSPAPCNASMGLLRILVLCSVLFGGSQCTTKLTIPTSHLSQRKVADVLLV